MDLLVRKPKPFKHVECPTSEEISNATSVLGDFVLSLWQELYSQGLSLPGNGGHFSVELATYNGKPCDFLWIKPTNPIFAHYAFVACNLEQLKEKIKLVMDGIKNDAVKKNSSYCCPLAEHRFCVCTISWDCPLHGTQCVGTHD